MKKFFFNLTFYPLFILVTLIMFMACVVPLYLMLFICGERKTLKTLRWVIFAYGWMIIRGLTFPFVRIEVKKKANAPAQPAVFVCNHRSSSDAFLMALLGREVVQVVNNWPFKIPVIGWVAKTAGYLSIRSIPFELFLEKGKKLLADGVSVVAFPEGSRSMDGQLLQFNGAVFRLAQEAQVPIVPVCLSGNQKIPEKGTNILHPGTIKVHLLPALEWQDFRDWTPFKLKNQVREMIQNEVNILEKTA